MECEYWLDRKRSALKMARLASDSAARLAHYDLDGRYSVRAANVLAFMLSSKDPATVRPWAALQATDLPGLSPPHPAARREPDEPGA